MTYWDKINDMVDRVMTKSTAFVSYKTVILYGGAADGETTYCGPNCTRMILARRNRAGWFDQLEYRETEVYEYYSKFELYDSVHN